MRIPLSSPDISEAEIDAVVSVMRTNTLSLGPKLVEFEDALAAYHRMPHAIAVSSGTAALHLAIRAQDIGEGDEVIVPSFTFIAVANAVKYERASPVFVDIDPVSLNLDPRCVEAAITPRTRAIVVVHTFGVAAEMTALMKIAQEHHLVIIEDACEAIGATYKGNRVGGLGDISIFAFYPNKQMTTGEGGAVLCRDAAIADRIRAMRNQGRYPSSDWLQHTELGYNYRLSEIACALGLVQLSRLDAMLEDRARVAAAYNAQLDGLDALCLPPTHLPDRTISWFVYVVQIAGRLPVSARDRVLDSLQQSGIGCARYFAPIHLQQAYADYPPAREAGLPVTESVAIRTLALPFFNRLTPLQMEEVCDRLRAALRLFA